MFFKRNHRRRSSSPQPLQSSVHTESLETRTLLAAFGTPWPAPRTLSVSFPTDNASIGAYSNSLRSVLDQVTDRVQWQEAALRAFQTWAVHSNINVGLVTDRGDSFGTAGLVSNDPRFGEFRIGAFPQPGILASALPYQQVAGTWSGDILLNTQTNWFLADPSVAQVTVPEANEKGSAVELFSVLLHEAGNALGIADSARRGTVMFTDYLGPRRTLTPPDIVSIRNLYGIRQDVYEPISNNSRSAATRIEMPPDFQGQTPVSIRGSLNTMADTDFYRFTPLPGLDKVNIRLWATGISLVKAKLEIFNQAGVKLADVKADSIFDNNLQIEIGSLESQGDIFIRVARNASDVFGIGDYRIDVDYRDASLQPSINPPVFDTDADDDDDDAPVPYISVDRLFSRWLVTSERGTNDTLQRAVRLETPAGFLPGTRYEAQSAVSSRLDRDFFRFTAPSSRASVLNVDLNPVGTSPVTMDIVVMNSAGDRVQAVLHEKAEGGRAIQIANPVPGAEYIIAIKTAENSVAASGNYLLTVDFSTEAAALQSVFNGSVRGAQQDYSTLESSKPQMFRFDLTAAAATPNEGIQLTFYNMRTRDIVFTVAAGAGLRSTEYVWLPRGEYLIRASARTRQGQSAGLIRYALRADVISDDQGPNPIDPTIGNPPPSFPWRWVDVPPSSPPPVMNLPLPIIEDPWFQEIQLDPFIDFYSTFA